MKGPWDCLLDNVFWAARALLDVVRSEILDSRKDWCSVGSKKSARLTSSGEQRSQRGSKPPEQTKEGDEGTVKIAWAK